MSKPIVAYLSFIGVDLHKETVTLVAVDPRGKVLSRLKIHTKSVGKIEAWLLALPRPSTLAVEAVGFVEWFIERFRVCVDRIDIADATELANRRGKRRKNDPNDAVDIARRLARGECPLGYIADEELMQLRKLGRHWRQLGSILARAKHSMRSILLAANLRGPKLDGAGAQRWLLAHGHRLKPVQQQAFRNFLDVIQLVELQRAPLRHAILKATRHERFAPLVELLQTVPGIGPILSKRLLREFGTLGAVRDADVEDLVKVRGMTRNRAEALLKAFGRAPRSGL